MRRDLSVGDRFIPYQQFGGDYRPVLREIMDGSLSRSMKRVLLVLNSYACENGLCYPSQKTIAYRMGMEKYGGSGKPMSVRQVRNILRELESGGWIEIVRPSARDRRRLGMNDQYMFLWHDSYDVAPVASPEISADTPISNNSISPYEPAVADSCECEDDPAAEKAIQEACEAIAAAQSEFNPFKFAGWARSYYADYPLAVVAESLAAIQKRGEASGWGFSCWGYGRAVAQSRGPVLAAEMEAARARRAAGWLDAALGGLGRLVGSGVG